MLRSERYNGRIDVIRSPFHHVCKHDSRRKCRLVRFRSAGTSLEDAVLRQPSIILSAESCALSNIGLL